RRSRASTRNRKVRSSSSFRRERVGLSCSCPHRSEMDESYNGPLHILHRYPFDAYLHVVLFFFQAEDGIRDWSVTGVQTCALPISGAGHSGISAFLVEAETPGFDVARVEPKMGIKGSTTGELVFEEARVPAANLLDRKSVV